MLVEELSVERWAFSSEIAPQPWHDCTNIKAKLSSRLTDSRFRAAAPPQLLMKRCRWPRNSWTRKVAQASLRFRLGPPDARESAASLSQKSLMSLAAMPHACWK